MYVLMMLSKNLDKSYKAYLPKYQINSSNYSTLPQDNIYVCTTQPTHLLHTYVHMTMTLRRPPNNYLDKKLHGQAMGCLKILD